jgi:hypothetical protein
MPDDMYCLGNVHFVPSVGHLWRPSVGVFDSEPPKTQSTRATAAGAQQERLTMQK